MATIIIRVTMAMVTEMETMAITRVTVATGLETMAIIRAIMETIRVTMAMATRETMAMDLETMVMDLGIMATETILATSSKAMDSSRISPETITKVGLLEVFCP